MEVQWYFNDSTGAECIPRRKPGAIFDNSAKVSAMVGTHHSDVLRIRGEMRLYGG